MENISTLGPGLVGFIRPTDTGTNLYEAILCLCTAAVLIVVSAYAIA